MKKAILLFLLIIAAIGVKAQDEQPQLPPDLDMLRFFYVRYMVPYTDGTQPSGLARKQSQMRRTFCTAHCLEQYQQIIEKSNNDDDPFIKAPDADREAIRSLQFTKNPKQPGRYTVTYEAGEKIIIELGLIKDKEGAWKIDRLY